MLILRDPTDLHQVQDLALRQLIADRFESLRSEDYDWSELGYQVVAEPGDSIADLEAAHRIAITTGHCCPVNFGSPGFIPSFELIQAHGAAIEIVWVLDDSGYGVTLWVPYQPETELLAFARHYTEQQQAA